MGCIQQHGLVILHPNGKFKYSGALKLSANRCEALPAAGSLALKQPIKSSFLPPYRSSSPLQILKLYHHISYTKFDRMSSSVNNNHSNGPSSESEQPNNSFPTSLPAQNGPCLSSRSILILQCKGNTGDQASPAPSQATANGGSQVRDGPNSTSYTGLLSQNGKHLINFHLIL